MPANLLKRVSLTSLHIKRNKLAIKTIVLHNQDKEDKYRIQEIKTGIVPSKLLAYYMTNMNCTK